MAAHMRLQANFACLTLFLSCMLFTCHTQNLCQLPIYHMANLTQRLWKFYGKNTQCLSANESDCIFHVRFCSPVGLTENCGDNTGVCETLTNMEENYRIAGYTDKPFTQYTDATKGFKATFPSGQVYNHTVSGESVLCNLSTVINFSCEKSKPWVLDENHQNEQDAPFPPIEIRFNPTTCQYNITFEFAGACLTFNPSITISNTLSAGSVLVIMFFVFLLSYFVFGSIWNIGCRGARGKEVIPNLDFWTMLPVYVADGILFTFRCGQVESSSYESI